MSSIQFVGSCTKIGNTLMPKPWSNFCRWNCLANSLNKQKTHIRLRAHIAFFIFLIIKNLIKAPATRMAMMSFKNQASYKIVAKLSKKRTMLVKIKATTNVVLLRSVNSISKSCEYIIMKTNENMPITILWTVKIVGLSSKNICK